MHTCYRRLAHFCCTTTSFNCIEMGGKEEEPHHLKKCSGCQSMGFSPILKVQQHSKSKSSYLRLCIYQHATAANCKGTWGVSTLLLMIIVFLDKWHDVGQHEETMMCGHLWFLNFTLQFCIPLATMLSLSVFYSIMKSHSHIVANSKTHLRYVCLQTTFLASFLFRCPYRSKNKSTKLFAILQMFGCT